MSIDDVMSVKVWGWLFAVCLLSVFVSGWFAYDAHNTSNAYNSTREQDIANQRRELRQSIDALNESLKARIDSNGVQLKLYVDLQVPLAVRNAAANTPTLYINNTSGAKAEVNKSNAK
jgi:hypothetical protein